MKMFYLLVALTAASTAQAGGKHHSLLQHCIDASGFTARAAADPARNEATRKEMAYIRKCVGKVHKHAHAHSTRVVVAKPVRKRVIFKRRSVNPNCPPYAPVLYRGNIYCVGN